MEQQKIDQLARLLKEIVTEGKDEDPTVDNFQFVDFTGDIEGKGFIWSGTGYNKQFIFVSKPDRFFISEHLDLAREKHLSINGIPVVSQTELGTSVTKSSLREVGRLKGLLVDGSLSVNNYLYFDSNTDRLGIGTENPKKVIDVVEDNVEILIGASDPNVGAIGTFNSQDFQILTDNTARITVSAGGNIILGNINSGPIQVNVLGKLTVNVNTPDSRANLHVNGPIKFNNKLHMSGTSAPAGGSFAEGDIVWNSEPIAGAHVGWVCTRAGNPGLWNPFGRIE
jgi:hypothetical protein